MSNGEQCRMCDGTGTRYSPATRTASECLCRRQYERVDVGYCGARGVVSAVVVAKGDPVDSDHAVTRVYHGGHVHDVLWSPGRMLYLFKPAAAASNGMGRRG
jgi:hypothetical protein